MAGRTDDSMIEPSSNSAEGGSSGSLMSGFYGVLLNSGGICLSQERQGVPARWGDPARGIPTPKELTVGEKHKPGRSLEPGPHYLFPLPKEVQEGGGPGRKEGPGLWCSSACTGPRSVGIPRAGSPQRAGSPRIFPLSAAGVDGPAIRIANPGDSHESIRTNQQPGIYPYPLGAGSARPNPKMGAPDQENPLFLGFSVLRGGLRPWSQTVVSEGARPWGRGRSEFAEQNAVPFKIQSRK